MKRLKKIIFGLLKVLLILVALYLIVALFAPGDYRVERSQTIEASPEIVYDQIAYFENWEKWSPWEEKDSTLVNTLTGEDGTVGATQSWTGDPELSGKGKMTMTALEPGQMILYDLTFEDMNMTSHGGFIIKDTAEKTSVTWYDEGDIPFLFRPIAMFYDMDAMIGADFERGLTLLDSAAVEAKKEQEKYKIERVELPESYYYGVRKNIPIEDVDSTLYGSSYGLLGQFFGEQQIEMKGMPVGIVFDWNEESGQTEIMPAFPVESFRAKGTDQIEQYTLPKTKAVVLYYYGPYEETVPAHEYMEEYMKRNNLSYSVVMEEFVDDPATKDSMDEVLTKIYYILE